MVPVKSPGNEYQTTPTIIITSHVLRTTAPAV